MGLEAYNHMADIADNNPALLKGNPKALLL